MEPAGIITVKGIVQGVGFRPFVYAKAINLGIRESVKNLGSEVEIKAAGLHFPEFVRAVSLGSAHGTDDSVDVHPLDMDLPKVFSSNKVKKGLFRA